MLSPMVTVDFLFIKERIFISFSYKSLIIDIFFNLIIVSSRPILPIISVIEGPFDEHIKHILTGCPNLFKFNFIFLYNFIYNFF